MTTACPSRQSATAVAIASSSPSPRRTGNAPPARIERAEREPEELGLRHEAEEPPREEVDAERPGVEVRPVVRREHESARLRDVLDRRASGAGRASSAPACSAPATSVVEPARPGRRRHARQYRGIALCRRRRYPVAPMAKSLVIVESPREGADDRRLPRRRLRRGVEHRPRPRPPEPRVGRPDRGAQALRRARRRRRAAASSRTTSSTRRRRRSSPR